LHAHKFWDERYFTNSLEVIYWSFVIGAFYKVPGLTAGCIDTGLPAGRRNFGQSVKTLIETANVHHAR